MKYLLILALCIYLNANEFPFIQPLSVEKAPAKTTLSKQIKKEKETKRTQKSKVRQVVKKTDSDKDGVVDEKDKCPNTSKDFIVDYQGCPKTAKLKINFAPKSHEVTKELVENLNSFALFLKNNKSYQVVIYGYTDNTGNSDENKILSQQRAEAVKKALESYGIRSTRLTAVGMGERDPIADNTTQEGRAKNRRIDVELIY